MNSNRIPPDQQFVVSVKKLLQNITEYKGFARSGADSIRMYRVFSALTADKTLTTVKLNNKRFRLIFTPDDGVDRGLVYKMEYTTVQTTGSGISSVTIATERETVSLADGTQSWIFGCTGSDYYPNPLITIKFYFWASGTGTFTTVDL